MARDPDEFDADAFVAWCAATQDMGAFERRLARVPAAARPAVVAGLRGTLAASVEAPAAGETNAQGRDRRGREGVRRWKLDLLARLEARWWHEQRLSSRHDGEPP